MKTISVVFMGTPAFSVPILKALKNNEDFDVMAVFTQPDRKVGRKQILTPPPVKIFAQASGIPVYQCESSMEIKSILCELKPDFLVVASYGLILTSDVLNVPVFGSVNIHTSLLPRYRGASPIQTAILNGDKVTGVTFMQMSEKLDAGDILYTEQVPIDSKETAEGLFEKLSQISAKIIPGVLIKVVNGDIKPKPQDESQATYCKKLQRQDGRLDFENEGARALYNRFRAFYPWPGCFTEFNGKRLKILDAEYSEKTNLKCGEWFFEKNIIRIGTKSGEFILKSVQIEGKTPMKIIDFLRGLDAVDCKK